MGSRCRDARRVGVSSRRWAYRVHEEDEVERGQVELEQVDPLALARRELALEIDRHRRLSLQQRHHHRRPPKIGYLVGKEYGI